MQKVLLCQKLLLKVILYFNLYIYIYIIDLSIIKYGPSNESALIGSNIEMPCKLMDEYVNRKDISIVWYHNVFFLFFKLFNY